MFIERKYCRKFILVVVNFWAVQSDIIVFFADVTEFSAKSLAIMINFTL